MATVVQVIHLTGEKILDASVDPTDQVRTLRLQIKDLVRDVYVTALVGPGGVILDESSTIADAGLTDGDILTVVVTDLLAELADAESRKREASNEEDIEEFEKACVDVGRIRGQMRDCRGGWEALMPDSLSHVNLDTLFLELRQAWQNGELKDGVALNTDEGMEPLLHQLVVRLAGMALKEVQSGTSMQEAAVSMLHSWSTHYFSTREDIASMGIEARWEFDRLKVVKPAKDALNRLEEVQREAELAETP
eukprot:TRINITY_DN28530_c0_g2_i1.p1 TRINITY_DN28530_c0_g2~~TRINITY_DN28530_c0_g2_i1.p1  ORF type:complete len:250 (-),score=54.40 TRINITY_DN28530_c0_g2_i1:151-900(-)